MDDILILRNAHESILNDNKLDTVRLGDCIKSMFIVFEKNIIN